MHTMQISEQFFQTKCWFCLDVRVFPTAVDWIILEFGSIWEISDGMRNPAMCGFCREHFQMDIKSFQALSHILSQICSLNLIHFFIFYYALLFIYVLCFICCLMKGHEHIKLRIVSQFLAMKPFLSAWSVQSQVTCKLRTKPIRNVCEFLNPN